MVMKSSPGHRGGNVVAVEWECVFNPVEKFLYLAYCFIYVNCLRGEHIFRNVRCRVGILEIRMVLHQIRILSRI